MSMLYGKPYSYWAKLNHILDKYGATPWDVEHLLAKKQQEERAARIKDIIDKALSGRGLGSMTAPGAMAETIIDNRDAIMEALR